jgi:tetratricopeptide (TPR) repeat protein
MKRVFVFLVLLFSCSLAVGQHPGRPPVTLMSGLGDLHHPVTTSNPEAQKFFDQGLRLVYAFNHDEARRSFQRAAELDPSMAMAYWGIAEAVGPNYNDPASARRRQQAYEAVQKAKQLSAKGPAHERAYIDAMAERYSDDSQADLRQLAVNYANAMREVARKYPDDLDASVLFAESLMNLHPWDLWKADGSPQENTLEIVSVLESVMRRDPNHMGAVHYYIHAVEASPNPDRALAGAQRLAPLAPAAGHLVHMPAHVYIRTGYYQDSIQANQKAAAADRAFIQATGAQGIYPMMYYSHNLHFIAISAGMTGQYQEAWEAAQQLAENVRPHLKEMPSAEAFVAVPLAVQVRFQRWNDILQMPQPDPSLKILTSFWHFGRGMAFANTGKLGQAEAERGKLAAIQAATPPDLIFSMPFNNKARSILSVANDVLAARIACARKDQATEIRLLRNAVATEDSLNYNEPPDWPFPVRESLGAALLEAGQPQEAEKVFRADLEKHPRNPRSLFGLHASLKIQGKNYDAELVQRQFQEAWKNSGVELTLANLGT